MNTFHIIFKNGMERYIRADYDFLIGEHWDFYNSQGNTEKLVETFPASEIEAVVQVDE